MLEYFLVIEDYSAARNLLVRISIWQYLKALFAQRIACLLQLPPASIPRRSACADFPDTLWKCIVKARLIYLTLDMSTRCR